MPPAPVNRSRARKTVVSAAPTSTTNITGFFASVTGFSLTKESFDGAPDDLRIEQRTRVRQLLGKKRGQIVGSRLGWRDFGRRHQSVGIELEQLSLMHQEMLDDRTQRERGKEGQRADDNDSAHQQPDEQRAVRGKCSAGDRRLFSSPPGFRPRPAAECMNRKRPISMAKPMRQVVPGRVRVDAAERAAVVAGAAGVGVQNFREAVRSAVVQVGGGRAGARFQ